MFKKILLFALLPLLVINVLFFFLLKFPLWTLPSALQVGSALSSKLACSARYISGFSPTQIRQDIASYSAATKLAEVNYDDHNKVVRANMLGLAKTEARFRPGIGCSLQSGDTRELDKVTVPPLPDNPTPWPAGNRVDSIRGNIQQQLQALLHKDNEQNLQTRALLVVKNGQVVAEAYGDGIDENTALLGWSMGKSLSAMILGHLTYQERVSATQKALFAAWQQDQRAQISLEHVLHMTTGLEFNELYMPGSDASTMLFDTYSASDYAMRKPLAHAPGSHFSYSSGTSNLLTRYVFEQLGGHPQLAYDYLYQDFFAPLGMHNAWFEPDASGVWVGSSYLYLTARDWGRLALLMLNKGTINGQRLLSEEWVIRASQPNGSDNDSRYGYQFWLNGSEDNKRWPDLPDDTYAMRGNRQQIVAMIPSQQLAIVRIGWTTGSYPHNERLAEINGWF